MSPLVRIAFASLATCLFAGVVSAQHFLLNQIGDTSGTVTHMPNSFFSQHTPDDTTVSTVFLDDFSAASYELRLTGVQGAFNNFFGTNYSAITGWRVEIYSNPTLADTTTPPLLVGDVFSTVVPVGSVTLTPFNRTPSQTDMLVSIPFNFDLPAAGTYWIGIMPIANSTDDFFFVSTSTLPGNNNAVAVNPFNGLGSGTFVPSGTNAAYAVTAVPEPATYLAGAGATLALGCMLRRRRTVAKV